MRNCLSCTLSHTLPLAVLLCASLASTLAIAEAPSLPAYLVAPAAPALSAHSDLLSGGGAGSTDKVKRFALSLSLGLKPDMASLGQTITQDGTVDTADTTLASIGYATGKAIMSDRDNLAIWHNSSHTDSVFKMVGADPVLGGPLLGLDLGATAQYELDDLLKLPLFVRTGFHYAFRMSGGHQERVLGDVSENFLDLAILLNQSGEDPADYSGGKMITDYNASWYEIPISIGFKVPVSGHSLVYASFGLSYFGGGFSVGLDVDEKYANVLASHITPSTTGSPLPDFNNYSPGAVKDTVSFDMSGLGINYGLGAQVDLGANLVWFFELNGSGTAKTVYSNDLSPEASQLLTATSSKTLADNDPKWFKRLAFPVVVGGGTVRTGLRLYLF